MKAWCIPLLFLAAVISLSGCANIKQSNRITFVTAIGVDKLDEGVEVHALVAIPGDYAELSPGGGTTTVHTPNYILTQSGRNVADAIYKMKLITARDIEFGQTKIILFADEMAKEGLNPSLDFFMRREEFQPIVWLGYTKGTTKSILEVSPKVPETVSDVLTDTFAQSGSDTFEILPVYLYKFYSLTDNSGQNGYMPIVEATEEGNKLQISGTALYTRDKTVGTLTPVETRTLQLLQRRKLKSTSFTEKDGTVVLVQYHTRFKMDKDTLVVRIEMKTIMDQSMSPEITTPANLHELEDEVSFEVKEQTEQLIEKLQGLKTDPIGLGDIYRTKINKGYLDTDEWVNDTFPRMKIKVSVNTKIIRVGVIR